MSRPNPYLLTGVLLVFVVAYGGLSLMQGGLYLDTHEGDTYHLLDILVRMEGGRDPHADFVTPLGVLAFIPIVLMMKQGLGIGMAILWAQVAVALILLPAVAYAAASRLPRRTAYVFGLWALGLILALTYGGATSGASISMHYNRWAWSMAFVMLVLALFRPRGKAWPILDGLLIGALAAGLMMIKITFFVCLLPPVILALVWRRAFSTLAAAFAAGVLAVLAVTAVYGIGHWTGYLADLVNVTTSEVRPFVGVPFDQIVAGPSFIGGVVLAILSGFLLRATGHNQLGLVVLLLVPAFLYITYQNFGNDPKWLLFLPLVLVAHRPDPGQYIFFEDDAADVSTWLSVAAVALFFPSVVNLALSPVNHAALAHSEFLPVLPDRPEAQDIFFRRDRAHTMTAEVHLDTPPSVWAKYSEDAKRDPLLVVGGIEFPHCEILAGARAYYVEIAADLQAAGILEGSQFFNSDVLSAFWLFGPYEPLQNGAPWYYGGLSGLENADYVLIPKCSFVSRVYRIMAEELIASGAVLTPIRDNEIYALYTISR